LTNQKPCQYCGGVIFLEEDPTKERNPDGSMRWTCYNAETGTVHVCPQAPWNKKHISVAKMWELLGKLPVYCMECMCYYDQNKLCTHLEKTNFKPELDFPGNWHHKFLSDMKSITFRKKNSNTMYNRAKNQMQIEF